MEENIKDDGSLAFLKIQPDPEAKQFNCAETTQQKLLNTTFYVCDFFDGMKTRYGENRCLVLVKFSLSDSESEGKKFFTNSKDIRYVLAKIRELDAFPRRVTMRASGTRYFFE